MTQLTAAQIADLTEARLTLGRRGRAVDTASALGFALDHARAQEAVLTDLDIPRVAADLDRQGLDHRVTQSAAPTRDTFVRRPDLGRLLPDAAAQALTGIGPMDVTLVLGDGLSSVAVTLNGAAFLGALSQRLAQAGLSHGPVILARQARVALGDKIALAVQAQTVVMALGERPGLSAADSLGVYITHHPGAETADSQRNCLSNIRAAGLQIEEAADQALSLIRAMRQTGQSGVALSQSLAAGQLGSPEGPA